MAEDYIANGTAYRVPSDSDVADGPKAFREFADSIPAMQSGFALSAQSGNVTLTTAHEGKLLVFTAAATVTLPTGLPVGFACGIVNASSSDVVKIAKASGVTLQDKAFVEVQAYRMTALFQIAANSFFTDAITATTP